MKHFSSILEAIGNTPLVKLNKICETYKSNFFAKLEYLNPSGSIKDRMALYIIEEAERKGWLKPNGVIVENSSGNTGAALAMIAAIKGYRCIITIPDKMSQEKIDGMKAYGAEVIVTKTDVPADSPESYYSIARQIAKDTPNSYYPDQYNNPSNIEANFLTTGPEIWNQTQGEIDVLIAGMGTGGTLSGAGKYLKQMNPKIKIIGVDPYGSVFYEYFKKGTLPTPHTYKVEGIGEDYLVKDVDFNIIDDIIQVNDKDSFLLTRQLAKKEGIFTGGSSGSALWAAQQYAKICDKKENIVMIFPDNGNRYLSKIYNDEWMKKNSFL